MLLKQKSGEFVSESPYKPCNNVCSVLGHYGGEMSELDDAGTYFDLRPRKATSTGVYFYMSSRNNNFSNRSQKGKIVVVAHPVVQRQVGWGGGSILLKDG